MKLVTSLAVCAASLSTVVVAQTERELGAHEHGSAAMNIALDDNQVIVELETPWNNLVGFEHEPKTEEQIAMVEDRMALLNNPMQLFEFVGTDCHVDKVSLESSLGAGEHDDHDDHEEEHDDHKEEHDDHDEKHDDHDDHKEEHDDHDEKHDDHDDHKEEHDDHNEKHDDHDDHEKEHDDHAESESTHSEVLASYNFACDDVSALSAIRVVFLERWSGFEDLDVQLIGPGGQGLVELNAQQMQVDLSQVK